MTDRIEQAAPDDVMFDAWDELRKMIDRVICSLPSQLSKAVADMVIAQSRFESEMKAASLRAKGPGHE